MAGNTRPPVTEPQAVMPMARDRFLLKYVDTVDTAGQKTKPLPMPMHMPCDNSNCQYCVAADVQNMPTVMKTVPQISTGRQNPASVMRPVKVPMKKVRNTWIDPIHEMSEGGRFSVVT